MEFKFETVYNQKAFTEMAKVLRKTIRQKRSRRSHIFGWLVVILALFLAFRPGEDGFVWSARVIVTLLIAVILIAALIWEDALNGYVAGKRTLPGTDRSVCTFKEDGYCSETEVGVTEWKYEKPVILAETERYFVFLFSESHGQLYDKQTISGGTVEEFRSFLTAKTGKQVLWVK